MSSSDRESWEYICVLRFQFFGFDDDYDKRLKPYDWRNHECMDVGPFQSDKLNYFGSLGWEVFHMDQKWVHLKRKKDS